MTKIKNKNQISLDMLFENLKNGKITINEYRRIEDDIIVNFYSKNNEIDSLEDVEIEISKEDVVDVLSDNLGLEVIINNNTFYSLENKTSWVDNYGNLEEEADEEEVDRDYVEDAILEIILQGKGVTLKFNIEPLINEVEIDLNRYSLTISQWNKMNINQKKEILFDSFCENLNIHNFKFSQK